MSRVSRLKRRRWKGDENSMTNRATRPAQDAHVARDYLPTPWNNNLSPIVRGPIDNSSLGHSIQLDLPPISRPGRILPVTLADLCTRRAHLLGDLYPNGRVPWLVVSANVYRKSTLLVSHTLWDCPVGVNF